MTKAEKTICNFMASFFDDHYKNINKKDIDDCGIPKKEDFIREIRKNVQYALWTLTELCDWGMEKEYLKELFVFEGENNEFSVIKIHNDYIRIQYNSSDQVYSIKLTKPKKKTIIYFE